MCGVLALLFIVVPAVEIILLVKVGGSIGAGATLGVIILTGVIGAYLARHQGTVALRRVQTAMRSGEQIGSSLVEGALVLVAGVLMLTPGFITDAVGFLLLIPPVRRAIGGAIAKRVAERSGHGMGFGATSGMGGGMGNVVGFGPEAPDEASDRDDSEHDPPPPGVIDV